MNKPVLIKNKIILKEYNDINYYEVYKTFSLYKGKELVRYEEKFFHRLNFYSEFKKNLKRKYLDFFLLQDIEKQENIGFIYCYNYDMKNQNIFFEIFISNQEYYETIGMNEVITSYLNMVKINREVRTIYSHCFLNENKKMTFLKKCNFVGIGTMREYR